MEKLCLYKQDSDYALSPKHAKTVNMTKFWILQGSQYANVRERFEYRSDDDVAGSGADLGEYLPM